jgi:hypothetical protein
MVALPGAIPVTIPLDEPIVAIPPSLELHEPPLAGSVKAVADPTQTTGVPLIAPGRALTVTIAVLLHVVGSIYVMMDVPARPPVTTPVVPSIVATSVLPLVHVPPDDVLESVVVLPLHASVVPVIEAGVGLTVNTIVLTQPVPAAV